MSPPSANTSPTSNFRLTTEFMTTTTNFVRSASGAAEASR